MNRSTLGKACAAAAVGAGALAAYSLLVRPWHLRWGATDTEITEPLAGDDVKPDAANRITHAVTINAPPREVWKWLVQIGQGRGGFFSYDWLENLIGLDIHNSTEIVPQFQNLKVGDFIRGAQEGWLGGRFDHKAGWFVVEMEPERHLILRDEIEHGSWAFILRPIDENRTRLIIRARGDKPTGLPLKLFNYAMFEPAHFVMERKMLLTLKELAERSAGTVLPVPRVQEVESRMIAS
jgi:hypothetical protein